MHIPSLIERKRDGAALTTDEIRALIGGYVRGDVPDYQMAALAMAVFFRGMDDAETTALTMEMRDSGDVLAGRLELRRKSTNIPPAGWATKFRWFLLRSSPAKACGFR